MDDTKASNQCSHCGNETGYEASTTRTEKTRKDLLARLNRVEGQVRGIKGMIEKDVYCDDILNQIAAVQAAMNSVSRLILNDHMKKCLVSRIKAGDMEVVDELLQTIDKMMK